MAEVRAVEIRGGSIRLGQFLKLAGLIDTGSDVKVLMAAGQVAVNGEPEDRRGRQLVPGDMVQVGADEVLVEAQDG